MVEDRSDGNSEIEQFQTLLEDGSSDALAMIHRLASGKSFFQCQIDGEQTWLAVTPSAIRAVAEAEQKGLLARTPGPIPGQIDNDPLVRVVTGLFKNRILKNLATTAAFKVFEPANDSFAKKLRNYMTAGQLLHSEPKSVSFGQARAAIVSATKAEALLVERSGETARKVGLLIRKEYDNNDSDWSVDLGQATAQFAHQLACGLIGIDSQSKTASKLQTFAPDALHISQRHQSNVVDRAPLKLVVGVARLVLKNSSTSGILGLRNAPKQTRPKLNAYAFTQAALFTYLATYDEIRQALNGAVVALFEAKGKAEELDSILSGADERAKRTAIVELVRVASPVKLFAAKATVDVLLGVDESAVKIVAGARVASAFRVANYCPKTFDKPAEIDFERFMPGGNNQRRDNMAWGADSPHFCLGTQLSLNAVRVFVTEMLAGLCGGNESAGMLQRLEVSATTEPSLVFTRYQHLGLGRSGLTTTI